MHEGVQHPSLRCLHGALLDLVLWFGDMHTLSKVRQLTLYDI